MTVACCFDDDTCADLTHLQCMIQGGFPQGMGTDCATTTCETPSFTMACCFDDGTCADLNPIECYMQGGDPQGFGTDCATADCTPGGGGG